MSRYPDLRVLRHSRIFGLVRYVLFLFITLFLARTTGAFAATYYVDATGGNDSNNGTSTGTPWRTVAKVNGRSFSPGDEILFMRGRTWNESLVVSSSGASGRHIVYGAYGTGNRPVFNGGNTRTSCIEANNKDYITFRSLDALDGRTNGFYVHDGDPHDYLLEDCMARSAGDLGFLFKGTHNITFRNCQATENYWNGFAMQTFTATTTSGPYLFEDCDSYNNGHVAYDFQCSAGNQSNVTFRRCKARNNGQNGIYVDQDGNRFFNMTVEYCLFANNGRIGIIIDDNNSSNRTPPYAENITISNCVFYGNGTNVQTPVVPGEGIRGYMQNSRIRNCIIYNNNVNYSNKTELYVNDGGGTPNTCDYTLIYSPSMSNPINWDGAQMTQAAFRNAGQNTHGLAVNPLFVNPGAGNFALQANSPCINAGTSLGLTMDLAGKAVPSGNAPDMGAYEYGAGTGGGTPNPTPPAIQSVTISPNSGIGKVGTQITITVTAANGQTGLTASNATINGKSIPLRDSGSGRYTGAYTVAEGDADGKNIEASGITLTGTGGTTAPASSSGSTLSIDAHTPRISSVAISPNSGTVSAGNTVTITVTAANAEAGLAPSNATINGRSVAITEKGSGVYTGTYTVQAGDGSATNVEARNITLRDAAGNTSPAASSSGSTLAVSAGAPSGNTGNVYYVDSTGGNDSNNGTSTSTPWRTVAKVNGRSFSPGDQILFMRGRTWNESLVVSSSGASGNHIVYGAYGTGNRPVFNGGNTRTSCIEANNKDYITFRSLDALDGRTNGFYVHDGDPHDYLVEDCMARSAGDLGYLFKGTHNITFRNCQATENTWNGFACQAYTATYACGPYLFEDCDSYNNGHTGYDFQTPQQTQSNITMRRCIGRNNTDQGVFFDQDGGTWRIQNVTIEYCAFYNNGRIGIYFEDTDRRAPYANNITISNCLMYGNGQTGQVVSEGLRGYMQNARIRNCIIANNQARYSGSKVEMYVNDGGGTSNTCDYTLVYSPSTSTSISWDNANRTMASFQSSGQNTHGLAVNPLFVNPGAGNFALQANSPCINAGTSLGLTMDLAGKAVPSGNAPDLGVFEYGSGTPNPTPPAIQSVTISPNSGIGKVGTQIAITVTAANGQTGLTASNATINGKNIPLRDSGSGRYTGVYTVAEGDADGKNVEASGITLTGTGGTTAPASSSGSTLSIDAHTPRISSVAISPNSGTVSAGNTVTITVTAANAEAGLTATNATINGRSVAITEKGAGVYTGTYAVQAGDAPGANIEARDITLKDAAGNVSAPASSSGSTLAVVRSLHFQVQFRNTGSNAMIIVQAAAPPTIDGAPVVVGDEIGVFTPGGLCAGAGVWNGQNLSITVWGDDPEESGMQGFRDGERFQFRIWDDSARAEIAAAGTFTSGDGMYHENGVNTLGSLATGGVAVKTIRIPLVAGWNQVSSNIIPENTPLTAVLGSAAKSVSFVKNGAGQVYWPAYEIDQIGNWQVAAGYQIKAEHPDTLVIAGTEITPSAMSYSLAQGWNLISFTGIDGMSPAQAFASLGNALKLVKDGAGNVYYPQYGINQIGTMRIGAGYWVCTQSPATLNYSGVAKMAGLPENAQLSPAPGPIRNTGSNATLLVRTAIRPTVQGNALQAGDEIRVYTTEDLLVGKGAWDGTNCALAVQGDDAQTPETDGMRIGESLVIRIFQAESNREFETVASYETGGEGYQANALIMLSELTGKPSETVAKTANGKPQSFSLGQNFPNPFNPETTITFELPAASKVTLQIYNALGQEIRTLTDSMFQPGVHRMVWDGKNDSGAQVTSGVYFYTIRAGSFSLTRKMTLTR